jgi:nitrite reductase/ring-hydroxylating ferredoxin subunit
MSDWTRVSTLSAFGDQRQLKCRIDDLPLLLVRTGARVAVVHDSCTHLGKSLYGGRVMAGQIDLTTGTALSGPAVSPVTVFPACVEEGIIWANLTKPPLKPLSLLGGGRKSPC